MSISTPAPSDGTRPEITPEMQAFGRLLRAHSAMTRSLDAALAAEHGLTANDFEVLLHLAKAPDGRLRRGDLADRATLTPSGITRLLQGLEKAGLVERAPCETDGRVAYAQLTPRGQAVVCTAGRCAGERLALLFGGRYTAEELELFADLLARLPGADGQGSTCLGAPAAL